MTLLVGKYKLPNTSMIFLSAFRLSAGTAGGPVVRSVPPGASAAYPTACVSGDEIESYTSSMGAPPVAEAIAAERAEGERARSRTCVAPRAVRRAALCGDAVVMMGENLFRRATWMAVCAR